MMTGGMVGIDPDKMAQLIAQLSGASQDFGNLATRMRQIAARARLPGNRGMSVGQKGAELQGKLPDLRARLDLARTMNKTLACGIIVSFPESAVAAYLQREQQQQAGQRDAEKFLNGSYNDAQLAQLIKAHANDPYYSERLWATLTQGDPGAAREIFNAQPRDVAAQSLASALSVASPAQQSQIINALPDPHASDGTTPGREANVLHTFAPLLGHARFPASVLEKFGVYAIDSSTAWNPDPGPFSDPAPYINAGEAAAVFNALKNDPAAAAQFYHDHKAQIQDYSTSGGPPPNPYNSPDTAPLHAAFKDGPAAQAFAGMIRAATIPPPGASQQRVQLAAQNTAALAKWWADPANSGRHTTMPVQQAYGDIIRAHWHAVVFALTAPAPGAATNADLAPGGLALPPEKWQPFAQEAMRNPRTSARLLVLAHQQAQVFQDDNANGGSIYYQYQAGLTAGFFDHAAQQTWADMGKDKGNEWKSKVVGKYATDAADIGIGVVFDPGSTVKTIASGVAKDVARRYATGFAQDLPSDPTNFPAPRTYTPQVAHSVNAKDYFNHKRPGFPLSSVSKYDGGSFVENGKIPDPSKMNPEQLQAYNEWLQDPTVAAALFGTSPNTIYDDAYGQETGGQQSPAQSPAQ